MWEMTIFVKLVVVIVTKGILIFYPDDPLWDGEGCGQNSTCCSFNNPPWFSKQLSSPTTDDVEIRLCANQRRSDEDIDFEQIELYVQ